jgi:hypothetical protein
MILLKTTDLLRFKLVAAETTRPLECTTSWVDLTGFTPNGSSMQSNSINNVTLVGSPASGVRQVKFISICNMDTVTATVNMTLYDGTNAHNVLYITLAVGDTLQYVDGAGFRVIDTAGLTKTSTNISSIYTALTTNSYITWTYNSTNGTITAQPIDDTTIQKVSIYNDGLLVGSRSKIDFVDTDDERLDVKVDSVANKITIRNYDNRNLIGLIRNLLFELSNQGFVFDNQLLLNELTQYDGYNNINSQRRK